MNNTTVDANKIDLQTTDEQLNIPVGDQQNFQPSLGLESNFSNIEELEAEHQESSCENTQSAKKEKNSPSPNMKFSEVDQTDRSLALNRREDSSCINYQDSVDLRKIDSSIETCLENIIIRDATE